MKQVYLGQLKQHFETMTRILLRSRRIMGVSILLLLASVAVLSTATRRPCLKVSSTTWHVWKSGYMTKSSAIESAKIQIAGLARTPRWAPLESLPAPEPFEFAAIKFVPPSSPPIPDEHYFRPPPTRA